MMNIKHGMANILFVLFAVLFSLIASSKEMGHFKPTVVDSSPPEYRWISFVSSGPADTSILDDSPDGIRGMFYRIAFIANDDVFTRPTMRIDEIVYADAGCCWTIRKSWNVDFNELEKSGVQMPPPESSGIDSAVWLDTRLVKIIYGNSACTISNIGEVDISAVCELKK